jgi:hypothetical protein
LGDTTWLETVMKFTVALHFSGPQATVPSAPQQNDNRSAK